jgi:predicted pyridoxine 5'-phosphate oxidase superfamily flavin-nucleotide-binding protein
MREEPFHEGEIRIQERVGERGTAVRVGAMISGTIPPGARPFLADQRMLAVGSVGRDGTPWASLLFGEAGFASTGDGTSVRVELARAALDRRDVLWSNVVAGAPLGLLAIDLGTRRRLRINGVVSSVTDRTLEVAVREAYPNCPKYIQRRVLHGASEPLEDDGTTAGSSLDAPRRQLVERADTLFVASRHPERGADISHRGGVRGFVRVVDPTTLSIPDYRGNGMFNTLGNLAVDGRAGLVIPEFERGRALQLTGEVALRLGVPDDPGQPSGGTGRYWDVRVSRWIELPLPRMLRWTFLEASPLNPS